jgi:hypothetical protein
LKIFSKNELKTGGWIFISYHTMQENSIVAGITCNCKRWYSVIRLGTQWYSVERRHQPAQIKIARKFRGIDDAGSKNRCFEGGGLGNRRSCPLANVPLCGTRRRLSLTCQIVVIEFERLSGE